MIEAPLRAHTKEEILERGVTAVRTRVVPEGAQKGRKIKFKVHLSDEGKILFTEWSKFADEASVAPEAPPTVDTTFVAPLSVNRPQRTR